MNEREREIKGEREREREREIKGERDYVKERLRRNITNRQFSFKEIEEQDISQCNEKHL